jgi:hypothetical protein
MNVLQITYGTTIVAEADPVLTQRNEIDEIVKQMRRKQLAQEEMQNAAKEAAFRRSLARARRAWQQ